MYMHQDMYHAHFACIDTQTWFSLNIHLLDHMAASQAAALREPGISLISYQDSAQGLGGY